jgi:hypothetical protein
MRSAPIDSRPKGMQALAARTNDLRKYHRFVCMI